MSKSEILLEPLRNRFIDKEGKISLETYLRAATSDNTRKAYRHDVRHFLHWGGLLPATTETIINYLQAHASSLNPRTLVRRLTALKNWHTVSLIPRRIHLSEKH